MIFYQLLFKGRRNKQTINLILPVLVNIFQFRDFDLAAKF